MKRFLTLIVIVFSISFLPAQELNCSVIINSDQIAGSEKSMFENLQRSVRDFINNRKWTTDEFKPEERIDCSILITLTDRANNYDYTGTIQITSRRPVFGSTYMSPVFKHQDKDFKFTFQPFDILDFSENNHLSNLTSMLAFYVYMTIGMDYDSFSLKGGTPYFQKALSIVNAAQGVREPGWTAAEGTNNRYWIVQNLIDPRFENFRLAIYNYHREGFDKMSKDATAGRLKCTESIESLIGVNRQVPNSITLRIFFSTKSMEIINLYSQAPQEEKTKILNTLTTVDPANTMRYNKIIENR